MLLFSYSQTVTFTERDTCKRSSGFQSPEAYSGAFFKTLTIIIEWIQLLANIPLQDVLEVRVCKLCQFRPLSVLTENGVGGALSVFQHYSNKHGILGL
jgi:hypothetical protein